MLKKFQALIDWLRYRIGFKYFLFFLVYITILITTLLIIRDQMSGNNNFFYALPAIIIGYDRLFAIIRKGLNYGLSRIDQEKEANETILLHDQQLGFAELIVNLFYFWQTDWKHLRKQGKYWTNWTTIQTDFKAVLNNDWNKLIAKYKLDPNFIQFQDKYGKSYYFQSLNKKMQLMRQFKTEKAYLKLKRTSEEFGDDIIKIRRIFQLLFMWINSIQNQLVPVKERSEQKQTYFEFVNTTLKGLIMNNFLAVALDLIEKKYAKYI